MQGSPVQFEFEDLSPVEKRLKVEIAREQVNAKLEQGYRELGRQVNLRGFRKGKAPRSLLENMFGKKVAADAVRELINESMAFVTSQRELRMVSEPVLEAMPEVHKNEPLRYSARIELLPQITVNDWIGIEVTRRAPKVTDEQVSSALERKRQQYTEMVPIEGRDKTERDDVLNLSVTGTVGTLNFKDKEMQVDLGRPEASPLPGLAELLVGVPLDAKQHEVQLTLPSERVPPELAGKSGVLKITVKSAHHKRLPDLDDDFAKDTGESETLQGLRDKLRADLLAEDEQEAKHEMRLQLVEELIKRNPVPLPPGLVQRLARNLLETPRGRLQLQMRIHQLRRAENKDAPPEIPPKIPPKIPTDEELQQAAHAEAVRNLSIEFVMMAMADQEKVEITEADLEKHLAEMARERDKSVARLKAELQREDAGLQQLRSQLRLEKALDLLESRAHIKQAEGEGEGAAQQDAGQKAGQTS